MGRDVHEKRERQEELDHNPACGHASRTAATRSVKITNWRKKRVKTRKRSYLDYQKEGRRRAA